MHNPKEVESVFSIKGYGVLENDFGYVETWDTTLLYQTTFKAIDSPEIIWSKIHPRCFTFA